MKILRCFISLDRLAWAGILLNTGLLLVVDLRWTARWPWPMYFAGAAQKAAFFIFFFAVLGVLVRSRLEGETAGGRAFSFSMAWWWGGYAYYGGAWLFFSVFHDLAGLARLGLVSVVSAGGALLFYSAYRLGRPVGRRIGIELMIAGPFFFLSPALFIPGAFHNEIFWVMAGDVLLCWLLGSVIFAVSLYLGGRRGGRTFMAWACAVGLWSWAGFCAVHFALPVPEVQFMEVNATRRGGPRLPDVFLISIDTLRKDAVGCYGQPLDLTPNMDSLAADGVTFADAYSASPWTLPSMASLFSGLYPSVHEAGGIDEDKKTLEHPRYRWPLSEKVVRVSEILASQGYTTRGCYENQYVGPAFKMDRGFMEFYHIGAVFRESPDHLRIFTPSVFLTRLVEEAAFDYRGYDLSSSHLHGIRYLGEGPQFVWTHFLDPHIHYEFHPENTDLYGDEVELVRGGTKALFSKRIPTQEKRRLAKLLYLGEVAHVDRRVGQVLDLIKARGRYLDSIIILVSDHGEEFWEHGGMKHGHAHYQEQISVPFIIKLPGNRHAGKIINETVSLVDFLPTLLDLLGISYYGPVQGRSLAPLIEGGRLEDRPCLSEFTNIPEDKTALVAGKEKLVNNVTEKTIEYYELENDPGEKHDLASERPARVRALMETMDEMSREAARLNKLVIGGEHERGAELTPDDLAGLRALGYIQ